MNDEDIAEEECHMDDNCPNCKRAYDEIDYEYQICHFCLFENKTYQTLKNKYDYLK